MKKGSDLPDELVEKIVRIASDAAIERFKSEKMKEHNRKRHESVIMTKNQLKAYRKIKAVLKSEYRFTEEEQAEYRWRFVEDLIGNAKDIVSRSELIIKDEERRRNESLYSIYQIENALELYRKECEMSSKEEEKRRYRIIYDMYISDEQLTPQEIAGRENISVKSVYRDIGIGTSIIAIYLYGVKAMQ